MHRLALLIIGIQLALGLAAIASAADVPRSSEVLVSVLLEFYPEFRQRSPDDFPPIAGSGALVKSERGFHFAVDGDQFDSISRYLIDHFGSPVRQTSDSGSGVRSASFTRASVVYNPQKAQTVVYTLGSRLPKVPESGEAPPRFVSDSGPYERADTDVEVGWAIVRVRVGYYGEVVKCEVLEASDPTYERQAFDLFKRSKFEPAFRDGRPVEASFRQKIRFLRSIKEDEPAKQQTQKPIRIRHRK